MDKKSAHQKIMEAAVLCSEYYKYVVSYKLTDRDYMSSLGIQSDGVEFLIHALEGLIFHCRNQITKDQREKEEKEFKKRAKKGKIIKITDFKKGE